MRIESPGVEVVEAVADLWVQLAADQRAHGSHLEPAENREVIRETLARHAVTDGLRVARDDEDAIVGFVTFEISGGAYEQDVKRGVVRNLYVVPARRDEGIGSDLLAVAETALAERGADVVALEAMADNEAGRRFYRRHGYDSHRVEFEATTDTHTNPDE
jgi:ribosomal protein S18 acetylase RimI-like enzyme